MVKKIGQLLFLASLQIAFSQNTTTLPYEEYTKPFKNPLKGQVNNQYGSLNHMYINWNEIENSESDGIDKIKSFWESKTKNHPNFGNKIIPRVQLEDHKGSYWPSDMTSGDYTSDKFKARLRRLIQRLGEVWDHDPRVALIEMGLIGKWGEHHSPKLTPEMQQLLGEEFQKAFKNKKVSQRYTENFEKFQFGIYWDSFAHPADEEDADGWEKMGSRWTTQIMSGEVADNWPPVKDFLGNNGNEFYGQDKYFNRFYNFIRRTHTLNIRNMYKYSYGTNSAGDKNYDTAFNALGYRYILKEATFPKRINSGSTFNVSFKVNNQGSSPFYYLWPVELSLLHPQTKQVVWKDVFTQTDLRTWLPGDNWQYNKNDASIKGTGYKIPALTYTETGTFQITTNVPAGEYILALAVLDPGGGNPGLRFSNKNYFQGGRHPLGKLGVNKDISSTSLNAAEFSDLQSDRISYSTQVVPFPKVVSLRSITIPQKNTSAKMMYKYQYNNGNSIKLPSNETKNLQNTSSSKAYQINGKEELNFSTQRGSNLNPVVNIPVKED